MIDGIAEARVSIHNIARAWARARARARGRARARDRARTFLELGLGLVRVSCINVVSTKFCSDVLVS